MFRRQAVRLVCAHAIGFLVIAAAQPGDPSAATAPAKPLAALAGFQPGMWALKSDEGGAPRNQCIPDPAALVQVHHSGVACSRLVIADTPLSATVHYSCPGAGWGRTTFKPDGHRHLRIATQGIADRLPFDETIDARRTGDCASDTNAIDPAVESANPA